MMPGRYSVLSTKGTDCIKEIELAKELGVGKTKLKDNEVRELIKEIRLRRLMR